MGGAAGRSRGETRTDGADVCFIHMPHIKIHLVELVLELDPVQAQRVEEALQHVHAQDDREGHAGCFWGCVVVVCCLV